MSVLGVLCTACISLACCSCVQRARRRDAGCNSAAAEADRGQGDADGTQTRTEPPTGAARGASFPVLAQKQGPTPADACIASLQVECTVLPLTSCDSHARGQFEKRLTAIPLALINHCTTGTCVSAPWACQVGKAWLYLSKAYQKHSRGAHDAESQAKSEAALFRSFQCMRACSSLCSAFLDAFPAAAGALISAGGPSGENDFAYLLANARRQQDAPMQGLPGLPGQPQ